MTTVETVTVVAVDGAAALTAASAGTAVDAEGGVFR